MNALAASRRLAAPMCFGAACVGGIERIQSVAANQLRHQLAQHDIALEEVEPNGDAVEQEDRPALPVNHAKSRDVLVDGRLVGLNIFDIADVSECAASRSAFAAMSAHIHCWSLRASPVSASDAVTCATFWARARA